MGNNSCISFLVHCKKILDKFVNFQKNKFTLLSDKFFKAFLRDLTLNFANKAKFIVKKLTAIKSEYFEEGKKGINVYHKH